MTDATFWWSIAGVAILAELLSSTFYLLMLALGFAAGAVAAHLGMSHTGQLLTVSIVASGATFAWHRLRVAHPRVHASADKNVELDIGETVDVPEWNPDHTARVKYRGALWTVELDKESVRRLLIQSGLHQIIEVRGNNLIVRPKNAPAHGKHPWA